MARLYADENFPMRVAEELRQLGHDVLTIQDAGMANKSLPDDLLLSLAAGEGRALLALNRRHFIRLHQEGAAHAGIIVCTFDPDWPALAARIHSAIASLPSLTGELIRVSRPQR